jgi:arginase
MPEALKKAGLHGALAAVFAGEVLPPAYVPDIDSDLGVRNPHAIAQYSLDLATQTERLLDLPGFPVILGGDCSILIGTALGLRRRGRYGLIYIDAHPDYLTPETSQTGGVAGMPLAVVTGRGLDLLTRIEGRSPYILESDVVVVGCRDPFQVTGTTEKWVQDSRIRVRDLEEVRRREPQMLAEELLIQMTNRQVDGVWIHLDVDVLHESLMPAVDSPEPGGLLQRELTDLLAPLIASPVVCGLQVTIYDPERDPDGIAAHVLVGVLHEAFHPSKPLSAGIST